MPAASAELSGDSSRRLCGAIRHRIWVLPMPTGYRAASLNEERLAERAHRSTEVSEKYPGTGGSNRLHVDADYADGLRSWKHVAMEGLWPRSADLGV